MRVYHEAGLFLPQYATEQRSRDISEGTQLVSGEPCTRTSVPSLLDQNS